MLDVPTRTASARAAWVAPLTLATALSAGCGHGASSDDRFQPKVSEAEVVAAAPVELAEPETPGLGQPLGTFQLTYYYVAAESDAVAANPPSGGADTAAAAPSGSTDSGSVSTGAVALASVADHRDAVIEASAPPANENAAPREKRPTDTISLYHRKSCDRPIAQVSRAFYKQLKMQGTGKLRDGRTINISGPCGCSKRPCFFVMQSEKSWGVGVNKRPLSPFRSVAVDPAVVSIGKLLYLPELDGLTMPGKAPWGGFVHDGCVIADDQGGNIDGKQLDFFVGHRGAYNGLSRRHGLKRVTVYDGAGRCERREGKVVRVHRNST
jgi:3D (Asp-Asp-Asp) domain-containing protein